MVIEARPITAITLFFFIFLIQFYGKKETLYVTLTQLKHLIRI